MKPYNYILPMKYSETRLFWTLGYKEQILKPQLVIYNINQPEHNEQIWLVPSSLL